MSNHSASSLDHAIASLLAKMDSNEGAEAPYFTFDIECRDPDGNLKWTESFRNLVTNVGKTSLLNIMFGSTAKVATWFLGLISTLGTGPAVGDTLASKAWTEATSYTAPRRTLSFTNTATQTIAATGITFTMTATDTINGCFVADASSGNGTVLYSAGTFTARSVVAADQLTVTVSLTIN
jgi:hypothetical protein